MGSGRNPFNSNSAIPQSAIGSPCGNDRSGPAGLGRPVPHGEWRARLVERGILKQLVQRFLEELLVTEMAHRGFVLAEQRVDVFEGAADGIFAEVVVERLEIKKGDAVQRPGGLVEVIR